MPMSRIVEVQQDCLDVSETLQGLQKTHLCKEASF